MILRCAGGLKYVSLKGNCFTFTHPHSQECLKEKSAFSEVANAYEPGGQIIFIKYL
jgi:hypothetical protein